MTPRRSLSPRERERLYDRVLTEQIASGLTTDLPRCNICGMKILRGIRWHQSHMPAPHAITGIAADGLAHPRCNLDHAAKVDTPRAAKAKRQRQRDIGAYVSSRPLPGGRDSPWKKKMNGEVVRR